MYDALSGDYDRFVNWPNRLEFELPFIEREIKDSAGKLKRPARVLDAACGTGMHVIALAQHGFQAAGADLSAGMIAKARENAALAGIDAAFVVAGFGKLREAFHIGEGEEGEGQESGGQESGGQESGGLESSELKSERQEPREPFDALICLGNSLPHLLNTWDLKSALADFAACLRPGGLLLLQMRNFDTILQKHERWMPPESAREGDQEWLFTRFYDFESNGLITFNILTLHRSGDQPWQQQVTNAQLRPLLQDDLAGALKAAGFGLMETYGSMDGSPFDRQTSGNLVIAAHRSKELV